MGASKQWAAPYRMTVVDDNTEFVDLLCDILEDRYEVVGLRPTTIDDVARTEPDILVVDLHPGEDGIMTGWRVIELAHANDQLANVPIVLCTAAVLREEDLARAHSFANLHLLSKPFTLDVLEATLARAIGDGIGALARRKVASTATEAASGSAA